MKYVIRSMSTSDWDGRNPVIPYHIYLMKPHRRAYAWWTASGDDIMHFDTLEAAEAEWRKLWPDGRMGRCDIAPLNHPVPVWDAIHHQPE